MINFLRRYLRYILIFCSVILVLIGSFIFDNKKSVKIKKETTLIEKSKEEDNKIFVDIKGAVITPGVYQMNESSRIIDVINLAGGLREDANTTNLNLSKKVFDEMYIIVYTTEEINSYLNKNDNKKEISCASVECICPNSNNDACIIKNNKDNNISNKTNDKISINNATKEELMTLSGIGEAKAEKIIEYRNQNGLFQSLEDLVNVSGISENLLNKIRDNITL